MKKGEKIDRDPRATARSRSASRPRASLKEGELHRGEIVLSGYARPARGRRSTLLHLQGPAAPEGPDHRRPRRPTPSSSPPRSIPIPRRRAPGRSWSSGSGQRTSGAATRTSLETYACVFLLNVAAARATTDWGALNGYVHEGGGLVVGAGQPLRPGELQRADPRPAPAGPARAIARPPSPRPPSARSPTSRIRCSQKYGKDLDTELAQVPVYRYWTIKAPAQPVEGTRTLLSYADGAPALLERTFKGPKTGRVLLWTTPLARARPIAATRDAWNEFPGRELVVPGADEPDGPYMAGTVERAAQLRGRRECALAAGADRPLQELLGDRTRTRKDHGLDPAAGEPRDPGGPAPQQQPGQWTVKAMADDNRTTALGFSVNPPHAESQFTPLEKPDLDTIFGKDGYHPGRGRPGLRE